MKLRRQLGTVICIWLMIIYTLAMPTPTQAATVALISSVGGPSGANSTTCGGSQCQYTTYIAPASADGTLAGNFVICAGNWAKNASITSVVVTDDKSDTFTVAVTNSADPNQTQKIWYSAVTTGAQVITATFNGANGTFMQFGCGQFNNVISLDGCTTNNTSGGSPNTVTAGSFTPTQTGDLVFDIIVPESGAAVSSYTVGSQSNITWQFLQEDLGFGSGQVVNQAIQWGQYSSVAALNPTATIGTINIAWGSSACFFKTGSAGTAQFSGLYISCEQHYNIQVTSGNFTIPNPCSGNFGLLHCIDAPGAGVINALSGPNSGTWSLVGTVPNNSGSGILMDWRSPANAGITPEVLSVTQSANWSVADCNLYAYTNANHTAPIDTGITGSSGTTCTSGFCKNTGTQLSNANLNILNVTPSVAGIFTAHSGVNSPQMRGAVSPCITDTAYSPGPPVGAVGEGTQQEMDENNLKLHCPGTAGTAIAVTGTENTSAGANGWAASGEEVTGIPAGGFPQMISMDRRWPVPAGKRFDEFDRIWRGRPAKQPAHRIEGA